MTSIKLATACGYGLLAVLLLSIAQARPAQAQGGIICAYGSKVYKECCKQSFKDHPKFGARARSDEIDACMNPKKLPAKTREKEPAKEPAKQPAKEPEKAKG